MSSQDGQILRVFDFRPGGLGESAEKVGARGREFVTADEPPVVTEPLLDPIVVKNGQDGGRLPDSPCAD